MFIRILALCSKAFWKHLYFYFLQTQAGENCFVFHKCTIKLSFQVISLIFSAGSLLLCMIVNILRYTHDRPNSFLGLINNLNFRTLKRKSIQKETCYKHTTDEENNELLPTKTIIIPSIITWFHQIQE